MSEEKVYLTKEGLAKLQKEYQHLTTVRRKEIAERIQAARELGDLSENAEYQAARDEQGFVEGRIVELEEILKGAEVIEKGESDGIIRVGSSVTVEIEGEEDVFTIVGSAEAEPEYGKISNESPVGKALLRKKSGDKVEVSLPNATLRYKIKKVA